MRRSRRLREPLRPLLAIARDDEQRVVDPERETHAREHVHDEDRELELLGEDRREPERDDDRDDRHQQRDQPGDDRAEDEEQDDQGSGEPELKLALLEILLREEVEVVVERPVSGDRDVERGLLARCLELLDHAGGCPRRRGSRSTRGSRADQPRPLPRSAPSGRSVPGSVPPRRCPADDRRTPRTPARPP